jgi:3' terminal RNA ribose 2'-O-methyltransferase Hen1
LADSTFDFEASQAAHDEEEAEFERSLNLQEQRLNSVFSTLHSSNARRVVDLGCGDGDLLQILFSDRKYTLIAGLDHCFRALQIAQARLRMDQLPPGQRERAQLWHGSLLYRDDRLKGFDAAVLMEVIEHLDPSRLPAFERVVFEYARPGMVIVTTPNIEYNVKFETLPRDQLRHKDHRFEWTRSEFQRWSRRVADQYGYSVQLVPIGLEDPEVGPPGQMGVFRG